MKLLFIYGPPASGKLTIAKEISKKTGFKLFHNHYAYDAVKSVLDLESPDFWDIVHKIRLDIFEAAIKNKVNGLVFTYVYEKDSSDDKFIKSAIELIEKNHGEIIFIHLSCSREKLLERVTNESRKNFDKVKTRDELVKLLDNIDFESPISYVENREIDTSNLTEEESVKRAFSFL